MENHEENMMEIGNFSCICLRKVTVSSSLHADLMFSVTCFMYVISCSLTLFRLHFVTFCCYWYTNFTSAKRENCFSDISTISTQIFLMRKLKIRKKKIKIQTYSEFFTLIFACLDQHVAYLPGVSVGLRCGERAAQWGSRWAPAGPSSPEVGGRRGPGCPPSAQDCPGWWDSPLLAPSSSRPPEELQPERTSLEERKGENITVKVGDISYLLFFISWCHKCSLEHQMCINTQLKIIHKSPLWLLLFCNLC